MIQQSTGTSPKLAVPADQFRAGKWGYGEEMVTGEDIVEEATGGLNTLYCSTFQLAGAGQIQK